MRVFFSFHTATTQLPPAPLLHVLLLLATVLHPQIVCVFIIMFHMFWSRFNVRRGGVIDVHANRQTKRFNELKKSLFQVRKMVRLTFFRLHSQCAHFDWVAMRVSSNGPSPKTLTGTRKVKCERATNDHNASLPNELLFAHTNIRSSEHSQYHSDTQTITREWNFDLIAFAEYFVFVYLWYAVCHLNIRTDTVVKELNHLEILLLLYIVIDRQWRYRDVVYFTFFFFAVRARWMPTGTQAEIFSLPIRIV